MILCKILLIILFFLRFVKTFVNDSLGCNAISWAPYVGTNVENNSTVFRLATGSCDNNVRIWKWVDGISTEWEEEKKVSTDSPHRGIA